MASFFDISLLSTFSNVFIILFIFTAAYAVLLFKNPFGSNKGINALLAASIAIIFIFSQDAIEVIKSIIPWYIVIMVGLMFVLLATSSVGAAPPVIFKDIGNWVLIIGLFIMIVAVSMRLGQKSGPFLGNTTVNPNNVTAGGTGDVASGSFSQNFGATIFHPKVLALILVMVVAGFAVIWIGYVA